MKSIPKKTMNLLGPVLVVALSASSAHAFGKKAPSTPVSTAPKYTIANPGRSVLIRPFAGVAAFTSPGGVSNSALDVQSALESALAVAMGTNSSLIAAAPGSTFSGCARHLDLLPTVIDFEMQDSLGFTFGFGSGVAVPVTPIQAGATDTFTINNLEIGLEVFSCPSNPADTTPCVDAMPGVSIDKKVLGNNLTFTIGSGAITAGGTIITNTPLMTALQTVFTSGFQTFEAEIPSAGLPWYAAVSDIESNGDIVFDEGSADKIKSTDFFTVYSMSGASDECHAVVPVACIAPLSTGVGVPSTVTSSFLSLESGQSVQVGDVVEVGNASQCGLTSSQVQ
jgi:hypothetical protein